MDIKVECNVTGIINVRICHACLCDNRKITLLDDVSIKKSFLQIICDFNGPQTYEAPVFLCWECLAYVKRFIKFRSQAQKAKILLGNGIMTTPKHTNFQTNNLYNINLTEPSEDFKVNCCEVIKKEETDHRLVAELGAETVDFPDNGSNEEWPVMEVDKIEVKEGSRKKKRNRKKAQPKPIYNEIEQTESEIEEERRQLALSEDYVNAVFKCEPCLASFPNEYDLKDHVSNKHEFHANSKHKCKICTCTFASDVALKYHARKHRRRFQCSVCLVRCDSERAAVKHYDFTHCTRTNSDYRSNKMTENGKTEELDDSIKQATDRFTCEFCDKSFRWKTSLRKHAETHRIESGQKRRPYCEPCRMSFTSTSTLQNHVKTSSKHEIQLKLRKMTETLPLEKQEAHIEQIKKNVTRQRQRYACDQCDKKFQWRGNLLRHMQSHAAKANGELECKPCNRTFSSIATYKQHMRISKKHVSEDDFNYMCSDCGKRFANKTRLKDHVDWEHLKNYIHKCSVCQKVFKTHTSLYLHKQVVHKNNDEHLCLCDHCGKPFANRTKLRSHILALHTSDAAYSCSICDARFNWHSCLSRHIRRVHKNRDNKVDFSNGSSA